MTGHALLSVGTVLLLFVAMAAEWAATDIVLLAGLSVLILAGVLTPEEAFAGFANEAMLAVAALFVVAAGMRETGALTGIGQRILGRSGSPRRAIGRMALWVTTASAFLNNTPLVAMMMPIVSEWCRAHRISPSRLLIPLSYLTVLGGTCTLIGTSTNLVVNGLMAQAHEGAAGAQVESLRPFGIFEISVLGIPLALAGAAYLIFIGYRLLPDRLDPLQSHGESAREYLVDLRVEGECRLIGQTVEDAGLRHLPGLFLTEITRGDEVRTPVEPDEVLHADDVLTFSGVVSGIVDLERIPGLVPAAGSGYEALAERRRGRRLCEAVLSPSSPLAGRTIRDADFRALYNAAVVAVHRGGARLRGRIGDIVLRAGDTLLLQTGPHFARAHRNDADFILVSGIEDSRPLREDRARIAFALLGLLLLLLITGVVPVVTAALLVAVMMVVTRCLSASTARESLDLQTLVTIGSAFGLGKAMEKTGAAAAIGGWLAASTGWLGPLVALAAFYLLTMLLTELISNNAAAVLMFPFAISMAEAIGVSPRPFAVAVMFAASLAFATPVGYQTNLMIYAPGGYRFTDFTRVGLPLNIILWILAVLFIPRIWPF